MLILLPPSEGKTAPTAGKPVCLEDLVFADQLTKPREKIIRELEKLGGRPVRKALDVMSISAGQVGEIELNTRINSSLAAPAAEVYTGVLYDRLDFATLASLARKRADGKVLIASGLWGMLRPGDRIPYYRLSMKPKLARIGGLAGFWRNHLSQAMAGSGFDEPGQLVLDMRSGGYRSAWKPKHAEPVLVRGFTESAGRRKVISHMAKAVRGDVARLVLSTGRMPTDLDGVAHLLSEAGLRIETGDDTLDVIEEV